MEPPPPPPMAEELIEMTSLEDAVLAAPESSTVEAVPTPPAEDEAEDTQFETAVTPAARLRLTLIRRALATIGEMADGKRRSFLVVSFVAFAQVVVYIVILSISSGQQCDQPFRLYLALATAKIGMNLPLSIYSALVPPLPSRRDTRDQIIEAESRRRVGSLATDRRVRTVSSLLTLASLIIFVMGNIVIFSESTCKATSPELWWTTLLSLVISWFYVAEVALIVIAVVFFLPLVILAMRILGFGPVEKRNEIGPLSASQIAQIPLVLFIPAPTIETAHHSPVVQSITLPTPDIPAPSSVPVELPPSSAQSVSPEATPAVVQKVKDRRFWRLLRYRSTKKDGSVDAGTAGVIDKDDPASAYVPAPARLRYHPIIEHLATCSICLLDYEPPPFASSSQATIAAWEPEPLRLLHCRHTFHSECIDSWFSISGRCPVCQSDVLVSDGTRVKESA